MQCVWIQTVDGGTVQVEQQILQLSPELWLQIKSGVGLMKSKPLLAPPKVQVAALTSVVEYCRFHRVPDRSDKVNSSACFSLLVLFFNVIGFLEEMISFNYLTEHITNLTKVPNFIL